MTIYFYCEAVLHSKTQTHCVAVYVLFGDRLTTTAVCIWKKEYWNKENMALSTISFYFIYIFPLFLMFSFCMSGIWMHNVCAFHFWYTAYGNRHVGWAGKKHLEIQNHGNQGILINDTKQLELYLNTDRFFPWRCCIPSLLSSFSDLSFFSCCTCYITTAHSTF